VGERSPWRLCRPAGEGGFPTPPNVERLESVWGWVPDVLGEPEEELGLLVAHPVAEGLQVYVHRVLTEVVENLQHQLHGATVIVLPDLVARVVPVPEICPEVVVGDEHDRSTLHNCVSATSSARRRLIALFTVSWYSAVGTLSATIPAPAWT